MTDLDITNKNFKEAVVGNLFLFKIFDYGFYLELLHLS